MCATPELLQAAMMQQAARALDADRRTDSSPGFPSLIALMCAHHAAILSCPLFGCTRLRLFSSPAAPMRAVA